MSEASEYAGSPVITRDSSGHRCGGCGSVDMRDDWMTFNLEASPGLRDGRYSIVSTITYGFLLCPSCYLSPASGTLRNAASDVYARPAPKDYGCVSVCQKPVRFGRRRKIRRRKWLCPGGCGNIATVYKIPRDITPTITAIMSVVSP